MNNRVLSSLILTILFMGTYAITCNYCLEGTHTVNGNKTEIGDVECENPTKVDCDEDVVSCLVGNVTENLTKDGDIELWDVRMRGCVKVIHGIKPGCKQEREQKTKAGYTINSFECKVDVCSTDYCNTGSSPELYFMMGVLIVLPFLVGQ